MLFCLACGQDVSLLGEGFCMCEQPDHNNWIYQWVEGATWQGEHQKDFDFPPNWTVVAV